MRNFIVILAIFSIFALSTASIDKRQVAGAMGGSGNGEEEAGGAIGSVIGGTGDIASEASLKGKIHAGKAGFGDLVKLQDVSAEGEASGYLKASGTAGAETYSYANEGAGGSGKGTLTTNSYGAAGDFATGNKEQHEQLKSKGSSVNSGKKYYSGYSGFGKKGASNYFSGGKKYYSGLGSVSDDDVYEMEQIDDTGF